MRTIIRLVNFDHIQDALRKKFPDAIIISSPDDSLDHDNASRPSITIHNVQSADESTRFIDALHLPTKESDCILIIRGETCLQILKDQARIFSVGNLDRSYVAGPFLPVARVMEAAEMMHEAIDHTLLEDEQSSPSFPVTILALILGDLIRTLESNYWKERAEITASFIDMFSHDIGLPLTSLKANVELLIEKGENADELGSGMLKTVLDDVTKINDMRKEALMLNKFDSGSYVLNKDLAPIYSLLQEVQVQFLPIADRRDQFIELDGQHFSARIDKEKMRHVLENLVSNAVKYTPPGGTIWMFTGKGTETFWIKIEDTGAGIPEGSVDKLFKRFARFHKNMASGTGLGLSIVKTIIDLHKGSIRYEPRVGGGSVFTIELPRK